jgi:glycine cleavage system transcriptional repressor
MRSNIVLTLTGTDRVGIVEEVTKLLLDLGGNVETSRMARLGGEFAILLLASMPSEELPKLDDSVHNLMGHGYKVTTTQTEQSPAATMAGWKPYRIDVQGADHEGIVHEIAHSLASRGINIETMETGTARAPVSGSPLFTMTAHVAVPPDLADQDWEGDLEEAGHRLNVDVQVSSQEPG